MPLLSSSDIFFCSGAKVPEYEKFQWLPVDHLCIVVYLVGVCLMYQTIGSYDGLI
jgi:hypothetical protein